MEGKLLTPKQAAERFQVSISWIYKQTSCRIIPQVRIGRLLRIPEKSFEKWIEDHTIGGKLKV